MNSFEGKDIEKSLVTIVTPRQLTFLWLIAGSLLLALLPFGLLARSLGNDIQAASAELEQIEAQLQESPTPPSDVAPLLATLEALQQQAEQLESAAGTIQSASVDWSTVADTIRRYDPQQLTISALSQEGRQVVLEGEAIHDEVVVDYKQYLEASGLFSRVLIQSIDLINEEALTKTPTATPTATAAVTPSPMPGLRDIYEIDDFEPVPIFLDDPQRHNFYPVYDVDKVTFLAKAQRYYRVQTTRLRPGVDTVIEVEVGDAVYRNDDRAAGYLSSEVVFQAESYDVDVVVTISNRGEYGAEREYDVVVEEVLPTPTLTPSPTPTDTPVPPQSPTPDLRDVFEPDEPLAPSIAAGETQRHNFYPDGDVDYLTFPARAGRTYRLSTSNLALGVDTILTVTVGLDVSVHDDRSSADLGSELVVTVPADRDYQALVTIANQGQFDPGSYYQISLKEIVPTPSPTPSPVISPTATMTTTESYYLPARSPGLGSRVPSWRLRPAEQAFSGPEAVRFVIVLDVEAIAP